MDGDAALATEQPALLCTLPAALLLLLHLAALLLALFVLSGQSWLPSRRELEVIEALAGRAAVAPALQAGDHVEWTHSRCYGSCPAYRVRMTVQGLIEFDGGWGTCRPGRQQRRIDVRQAQAVLVAAELALRDSMPEPLVIDAPVFDLKTSVAGQHRQLALTPISYGSQFHLQRFLSEAAKIMLDPDWLPEWDATGLTCKGVRGERAPFDPYAEGSPR